MAIRAVIANEFNRTLVGVQASLRTDSHLVIDLGVRGLLHKHEVRDRRLPTAVTLVSCRSLYISRTIVTVLEQQRFQDLSLTERDHDVLPMLSAGYLPQQIAMHLRIHRTAHRAGASPGAASGADR